MHDSKICQLLAKAWSQFQLEYMHRHHCIIQSNAYKEVMMNRLRHIFIVLTALYCPAVMANDNNTTQTDKQPCTCVFNMNRAWNPEKIIWENEAWKCTIYKDDGTCSEVQKVASLDDDNNAFLLAESSERVLSEAELNRYDATDLRLIRNEIFARHGYTFKSEDLRTFFSTKTWYEPVTNEVSLSTVEKKNIQLIKKIESKYKKQDGLKFCKNLLLEVEYAETYSLNNTIEISRLETQLLAIALERLQRQESNKKEDKIIAEEEQRTIELIRIDIENAEGLTFEYKKKIDQAKRNYESKCI